MTKRLDPSTYAILNNLGHTRSFDETAATDVYHQPMCLKRPPPSSAALESYLGSTSVGTMGWL